MLDMAWKFLNIGKANAEIERLEKALADEQAKSAALTKERDDAKKTLETNDSEIAANAEKIQAELTQANADLITAKQTISTVTKERDDANAKVATLTKERDDAKATIADPKGEIAKRASAEAAQITAGQGQPVPITQAATASPAAKPAEKQLKGLDRVQAAIRKQISKPTEEPARA